MSELKIKDLAPSPFFARFLEGQFDGEMSREEMQAVRGGIGNSVTAAYPSDSDIVGGTGHSWPVDVNSLIKDALSGMPSMPEFPSRGAPRYTPPGSEMVTMAAPSDSDVVEIQEW